VYTLFKLTGEFENTIFLILEETGSTAIVLACGMAANFMMMIYFE